MSVRSIEGRCYLMQVVSRTFRQHGFPRNCRQAIHTLLNSFVSSKDEQIAFINDAKVSALVGCSSQSHKSLISGTKCYLAFAAAIGKSKSAFPISTEIILAWSTTFRCAGTFRNYVGYVKTANALLGYSEANVNQRAIHRASSCIKQRHQWVPREKLFVGQKQLRNILQHERALCSAK